MPCAWACVQAYLCWSRTNEPSRGTRPEDLSDFGDSFDDRNSADIGDRAGIGISETSDCAFVPAFPPQLLCHPAWPLNALMRPQKDVEELEQKGAALRPLLEAKVSSIEVESIERLLFCVSDRFAFARLDDGAQSDSMQYRVISSPGRSIPGLTPIGRL